MVGLELVKSGWQFTVLTERGELIEEACVRSLEALRERFTVMRPTSIALGVDPRAFRIAAMLTELGHSVYFGGELAPELRPALLPLVERLVMHSLHLDVPAGTLSHRDVVFRRVADSGTMTTFLVSLEGPDQAPVAGKAMYFIGPARSAEALAGVVTGRPRGTGSWTLALGLFRLWSMGELTPVTAAAVAAA